VFFNLCAIQIYRII